MSGKTVGDPMLDGTDVGPLASEQQRDDVEHLVADAVAKGARALCGGAAPEGPGFYYPPTVLAGITPEMRVHTEEVFGPVATLYRVPDIDAAIELANGTEFGLGANAWTNDEAERARFIRDLDRRDGLRQRQRDLLPAAAVRRRQELRPRPGALRPGHPRVLQHQVGLDRRYRRPRLRTPETEPPQDNREPGKLALPGPQLGRLRGGYRLLVLVLRLLRAPGWSAKLNRESF